MKNTRTVIYVRSTVSSPPITTQSKAHHLGGLCLHHFASGEAGKGQCRTGTQLREIKVANTDPEMIGGEKCKKFIYLGDIGRSQIEMSPLNATTAPK